MTSKGSLCSSRRLFFAILTFLVNTVIWGGGRAVDREATLKAKDLALYHGSAIDMLQGHAKSFKFSEPQRLYP